MRLIIELWGSGEPLDEDRVIEIAGNLYGVKPDEVRKAITSNLRKGMIGAKYYIPRE